MPVVRRGEIPYPPQGMGTHADLLHTQKGFFGDWVHVYRHRNLGIPAEWSDPSLMYAGLDAVGAQTADHRDPDGEALPLLVGDGVRVSVSRRAEAMPFCERNLDHHQIRFYQRGDVLLQTELGEMTVSAGDFVVIGKGLIYREVPRGDDNAVLVFETAEEVMPAESMWDDVGYASLFVDYSEVALPVPVNVDDRTTTRVRVRYEDRWLWTTYDFDPCKGVIGWMGDPVIYAMNVDAVPAIGTARGFLPPPAHAVLMGASKSFFFNVLSPSPLPTKPAPGASYGAPAHHNDYDEVWFNHASRFSPDTVGHLWLFPRTLPHPGAKREPSYPPNPVRDVREIKVNFDTRAKLRWTEEAKALLFDGDPRVDVFRSLYGVPDEHLPDQAKQYLR